MESNSYIVTCKIAYQNEIEPFQFDKKENEIYKRLDEITTYFKENRKLEDFYSYLQEGQYWINVWTAYFLLEKFEFNQRDKLIGLNDESIFTFCVKEIEKHLPYFKNENQRINCKKWLIERKNVIQQRF